MAETEVLYNAHCPICRAEIDHYRGYAQARGLPLVFRDLNACDVSAWGLSPESAARRLHVRQNGRVTSGMAGFMILWAQMPRYAWLARIIALPGLRGLAHLIYERGLAPWLYARHLRRIRNENS